MLYVWMLAKGQMQHKNSVSSTHSIDDTVLTPCTHQPQPSSMRSKQQPEKALVSLLFEILSTEPELYASGH